MKELRACASSGGRQQTAGSGGTGGGSGGWQQQWRALLRRVLIELSIPFRASEAPGKRWEAGRRYCVFPLSTLPLFGAGEAMDRPAADDLHQRDRLSLPDKG